MSDNVKKRRLPNVPGWEDTSDKGDENTSRAGGASLALGSTEYKEFVRDRNGMDEFEQEKARLDEAELRKSDKFSKDDKWHLGRRKELASFGSELRESRERVDEDRLSTAERKVSHQVRKSLLVDDAQSAAAKLAASTETTKDDKIVKRRLPKQLKEDVYDDSVEDDDFFPGMSALKKYM